MRRCALVLGLALAVVARSASAGTSTQEVRLRIVDRQTGAPVDQATAVYSAAAWEGTFTGHGGRQGELFAVTAQSDERGAVVFPPVPVADLHPFGWFNTNYEPGKITVTRPGYRLYVLTTDGPPNEVRTALKWAYGPDLVIKLERQ